jgi:hypothetical protein
MKSVKFATQVEGKVLAELKKYAAEADRSISSIVTEALAEHLKRARVRPAFRSAMAEILDEHSDLFRRLAK